MKLEELNIENILFFWEGWGKERRRGGDYSNNLRKESRLNDLTAAGFTIYFFEIIFIYTIIPMLPISYFNI